MPDNNIPSVDSDQFAEDFLNALSSLGSNSEFDSFTKNPGVDIISNSDYPIEIFNLDYMMNGSNANSGPTFGNYDEFSAPQETFTDFDPIELGDGDAIL